MAPASASVKRRATAKPVAQIRKTASAKSARAPAHEAVVPRTLPQPATEFGADFDPAHQAAADALREFYLRSHRALNRLMTAHGASFAKIKLMKFIHLRGSVRSADLVEAFGFAPRTITEAVDGLERDGLAERMPDPDDRRAKRIALTDAGRQALFATAPVRHRFGQQLFGALSRAELKQLATVLEKLVKRFDEIGEGGEIGGDCGGE
jgi:DNA-binding MarR family transcriptional regulator